MNKQKSEEILDYLYSLERFGIILGLSNMNKLMELLDNPHKKFKSIHIAGTNGKGSTSSFMNNILLESGYNVGLYTSPHLFKFNERIRINNESITDNDLINITDEIRQKIKNTDLNLTFFEFTTAVCFLYFARNNIDIAVIEVGMGGRLDATNVINPILSIITNIDMDHMEQLGNTISKIAKEKAGIIKEQSITITGETNIKVIKIFEKNCKEKQSELIITNKIIETKITSSNLKKQIFETKGFVNDNFEISLLGKHQIQNACVAIVASKYLEAKGIKIGIKSIKNGLKNTKWQGRLDVVSTKPLILVDGAHNVQGITALSKFIEPLKNKKVLILGFAKDKNYKKMLSIIAPSFKTIIVTQGHYKPQDVSVISKEAKKYCDAVFEKENVSDAITLGKSLISKNDTMLVTGSLYMISDALVALRTKK